MIEEIQPGSDSRKNWRTINAQRREIIQLQSDLARVEGELPRGGTKRGFYFTDLAPFAVYSVGRKKIAVGDRTAADWRTFQVRHGYVMGGTAKVSTTGCDDADGEGTTPTEIAVPDLTANYRVWVEITLEPLAATIGHGASGWSGYPRAQAAGKYYRLLAEIDTNLAKKGKARVRMFQEGDIHLVDLLPVWLG
jgi:hypothetical protein